MRLMLFSILLICATTEVAAKQVITADVGMSEWHPPSKLTLDLDTGSFIISPPSTAWPSNLPKPIARNGVVDAVKLGKLRNAFRRSVKEGLADHNCVGADRIVSNAGVPLIEIAAGDTILVSSKHYGCWTPAAHAFHKELEIAFGFRPPT